MKRSVSIVSAVAALSLGAVALAQVAKPKVTKPRGAKDLKIQVWKPTQSDAPAPTVDPPPAPVTIAPLPAKTIDALRGELASALDVEASTLPAAPKVGSIAEVGGMARISVVDGVQKEHLSVRIDSPWQITDRAIWAETSPFEPSLFLFLDLPETVTSTSAFSIDCTFTKSLTATLPAYTVTVFFQLPGRPTLNELRSIAALDVDTTSHVLIPLILPAGYRKGWIQIRAPKPLSGHTIAWHSCDVARWL